MEKNQPLSSLLHDEYAKIICTGQSEHYDSEYVVRMGVTTEILAKINKAIEFNKYDSDVDRCRFELKIPFSKQYLDESDANLDLEYEDHTPENEKIYKYFYEDLKGLSLDNFSEKYKWIDFEDKYKKYITVCFHSFEGKKIIKILLEFNLIEVEFYLHAQDKDFTQETTLMELNEFLNLEIKNI